MSFASFAPGEHSGALYSPTFLTCVGLLANLKFWEGLDFAPTLGLLKILAVRSLSAVLGGGRSLSWLLCRAGGIRTRRTPWCSLLITIFWAWTLPGRFKFWKVHDVWSMHRCPPFFYIIVDELSQVSNLPLSNWYCQKGSHLDIWCLLTLSTS